LSPNFDATSRPIAIPPARRRRRRGADRLRERFPRIEALESRAVLSNTDVWSGLGVDHLWEDAGNWQGDQAPQPGDDLVFPSGIAGTAPYASLNDFMAGTSFHSITIQGSGYELLGNPVDLVGGITAAYGSGMSSDNLDTALGGGTVSVSPGGELDLGGVISGSAGLALTGGGTLAMVGSTGSTYTGTTTVSAGTLALGVTGGTALAGPLSITGTGTVEDLAANQVAGQSVSISGSGATLALNGNNDALGGLSMDGGTISLGAGTLTLDSSVTTVSIFGTNNAAATITGTTGSSLDLAPAIPITFDVAPTGNNDDLVIDAPIAGNGLTKTDYGTMQLNAAGTYTGPTAIDTGTVDVTASGALGTGTVDVAGTGALQLDGGGVSLSNSLTLNSSANALANVLGSNTLSGPITLEQKAWVDVGSGSTLTISGAIGDGGMGYGVSKIDSGTLVYASSQANTYTGTTSVNLGELDLGSTAANGAIDGPLVIGIGSSGSATVKYLASAQVGSNTNVTVSNSAATLNLNGFSVTVNSLTITNGLVTLPAGSSLNTGSLKMTGGHISTGAGSTFGLDGNATITNSPGGSLIDGGGTMTVGAATPTITVNTVTPPIGLNIGIPIAGTGGLTLAGIGTTQFSGSSASTYTGTTTVDRGTLKLADTGGVAVPGALVVGDGTHTALVQEEQFTQIAASWSVTVNAAGTLDFNGYDDTIGSVDVEGGTVKVGGAFVTLGGGLTMTGGSVSTQPNGNFRLATGVRINSSSTVATIGGNLDLGNATQTFTIAGGTTSSGVDLDISAAISDGSLIKAGAGTLELDGDNTYTGTTTVSAGTLQISNSSALGTGAATVNDPASLRLIGGSGGLTVPNDLTLDSSGANALANASGANTLDGVVTLGQSTTIAVGAGMLDLVGEIGDGGGHFAVTKSGTAELKLGGNNTYGGGTTVIAGTLQVSSASATGTGGIVEVATGATLQDSASTYDLPSGGLRLDAGSWLATPAASTETLNGDITLAGDATIAAGAIGSLTVTGPIGDGSNGYGLTSAGAGTLILGGTSTYTGTTTVAAGTLQVDGSIASSGEVSGSGGATLGGGGSVPTVRSDGTVQPGSTAGTGTLIVAGGTLNTDSTLGIRLDGASAGAYDQLSVAASGALTLNDPALDLSLGSGYSPTIGTSFMIVSMGAGATHSGAFDRQGQSLTDGSTFVIGNTVFRINYNGPSGDIILTALRHIDTWTGGGADNNWSTAGNWQGDVAPVAGDSLVFPQGSAGATNNDFAAGTEFDSIAIGDPGYTFTGSGVALDEGIATSYASGTQIFPLDVTLKASQTFSVAGGVLDVSGVIDDGSPSGGYALTEDGCGVLKLDGANTYTGGTTLAAGTIEATDGSALGTGTVTVDDPASLQLVGGITLTNAMTLDSSSTTAVENLSGSNTLNGTITLSQGTVITLEAGTLDLTGTIAAGTHGATALGSGVFLVGGAITGSGLLTVTAGATLAGTGTTPDLAAQANSTVQPGSPGSPGTLSIGSISLDSRSTLTIEIDGSTQYDAIDATGAADLGSATLSLSLGGGYIPKPGTVYTILSATGGVSATFDGYADGSTVMAGTYPFRINYLADSFTLTAQARTDTWTGGDGNGDWSDPLNWQGGYAPASYDALVFPGMTYPTILDNDLLAGTEFTSIEFDDYSVSISGNAIVLDDGITTTYPVGVVTFELDTTLNGDQTFTIAAGGTLDVSGVLSGAHALTKAGAGTLQLDGTNLYGGDTTIGAGILEMTNGSGLGGGGGAGVTVDAGAELLATGAIDITATTLTINGSGVGDAGALVLDDGATAQPASFALGSDAWIGVTNGSSSIEAPIGDGGSGYGMTIVGGGTLMLTAANTYTGTTDVTAGTLVLDDTSGPALAGPLTIDASGGGSPGVEDDAANQLTAASADVTLIGSGATLDLNNYNETAHSLTFTGGTVSTGTGTLTLGAGGVTTDAAASSAQILGNLDLGADTTSFTVAHGTVPGGVDLSIAATVGDGGLIKAGAGTLALSGENTYAAGTTIDAGIVRATDDAALGAGAVAVDGSASLQLNGGTGDINIFNDLTLDSSGADALEAVSGSCVVYGAITLGQSTQLAIDAGTMYLVGDIGDGGGQYSLTETGPGVLVLQGTNTYGGGTTVSAGLVLIESAAATGTSGTVEIADGATMQLATPTYDLPSGGLQLDGGAVLASTSSTAYTLDGDITLAGDAMFEIDSTGSLLVSGAIGGGHGLTSNSTGTLILGGISTYTGATTVSRGVLEVDGSIASSSGLSLAGGAALCGGGSVPSVTAAYGSTIQPGTAADPTITGIVSSGDLSMATESNFNVYLEGTTAGSGYDQLDVTGTVDLDSDSGAGANLNINLGFTPSFGDSFTLIANDGTDPVQGTFSGLPEGSVLTIGGQTFLLTYAGGPDHNSVVLTDKGTPTVTVDAAPNSTEFGQGVTFSVTVSGSGATPTGTVTLYDGDPNSGGQPIGTPLALDGSGQASVSTGLLSVGSHQIYVSYSGDPDYLSGTGSLSGGHDVTQDSTTTSVSSARSSTVYGTPVIFTALVSQDFGGTPTGIVDFFDGATLIGTGTLNSIGVATLATTTLSVSGSPHSITASYEGNSTSLASSSPIDSQTITPAALTITADSTSKTYGTTTSFTGTEFIATGLVNGDSVSSLTLGSAGAAAAAGVSGSPYAITAGNAVGSGLGNYTITYALGHLTVNPAPLTITANSTGKTYGQAVSFAGTEFTTVGLVNGDSISSVTLTSPGAAATAGVAGSPYAITAGNAVGSGLGNYTITYAPGRVTVAPAPLVITANSQSRVYGMPNPALTAAYSGFVNGETPASLTTPVILTTPASSISPVGAYPIVAAGATSTNYAITFQNGALSVGQAGSLTTMATPGVASVSGQAVSFTALVSPGPSVPTGVVAFFVDGTMSGTAPIDSTTGLATFTMTTLGVGTHTITAAYTGDANFQQSQSGAIQQVVNPAATRSILTATAVRNRRGQIIAVSLNDSVLAAWPGGGIPAGPVSFFVGIRNLGTVNLSGGIAELSVRSKLVMSKQVSAQYTGDARFLSSVSPKVKITRKSITAAAMARPFFRRAR
jgi:autotransporter-associated beta strand protein